MFVSRVVVRNVKCQPGVPEKHSEWEFAVREGTRPESTYCTSRWMFKSRYYHLMTGVMDEGTILGASWPLVLDQQINGRDMTDAECGAHTSTRPISSDTHYVT